MQAASKVLRTLLRPAVIFALRRGLKVQEVLDALKGVFVTIAAEELLSRNEKASKSKLAIMSGLQRREITWFLENQEPVGRYPNLLTKLIGQWRGDKRFLTKGKPKPLTVEGAQSEFFALVQSVSKDLNPYTVLFELERIGAIRKEEDKALLAVQAYEPKGDLEEGYGLWSQDAEDLILGVEENILQGAAVPNLHIATRYDNICVSALPEIRHWLLQKGADFHAEIRAFLSKFDKDLNPTLYTERGGVQVSIGSFSRVQEKKDGVEAGDEAINK